MKTASWPGALGYFRFYRYTKFNIEGRMVWVGLWAWEWAS